MRRESSLRNVGGWTYTLRGIAALFAVLCSSNGAIAQTPSTPPQKLTRHTVRVEGHPLAVWEKRASHPRRTILLVHGRTWSSIPDFDLHAPGENLSLMDALVARGLDVYAIDLRGYGGTPRDSSGWLTPSRAAADVRAVLDWIHAQSSAKEKPVLFGWSRGSLVSQLVAEKYPEALSALILFGRPAQDTLFPGGPPVGISAPRVANTTAAAKTDFITPGSISRGAMDTYVQAALTADPVHAEWRNLDEFNGLDDARVRVPTLLVIGEFDPFYSRQQKRQAERFVGLGTADKEWVILAGSDHAALIERAAPRLVQAIVSFLDRPRF